MRIYITRSTFEEFSWKITDGLTDYVETSFKLIEALESNGCRTDYVKESAFNGYDEIYEKIRCCDCLVAFTDRFTLASTWRSVEITYAHSGVGAYEKSDFHIPVFFYRGLDSHKCAFIESMLGRTGRIHAMPDNIEDAVKFFDDTMRR